MQIVLALLSLLMERVSLMLLGLIALSKRLNWKNVVFRMPLFRSWVPKVVVMYRFHKLKILYLIFWSIRRFHLVKLEFAGKSTLLNNLFGTNFREMDAFKGRHALFLPILFSREYVASSLGVFFYPCNTLFSGLKRLREFGLQDVLVLSHALL